jgi:hypothetical protein
MHTCPNCGSTDTDAIDCYDSECNECGTVFTVEGSAGDEDYSQDR